MLVSAGCATTFATSLTLGRPVQPATQLANYLEQHHLTKGIGDYCERRRSSLSSLATQLSSGLSRPSARSHRWPFYRQSSSTWYGGGFQFLVYNGVVPWDDVEGQSALYSFGAPSHVASVGRYRVLTWAHDLTIRRNGTFAQRWAT